MTHCIRRPPCCPTPRSGNRHPRGSPLSSKSEKNEIFYALGGREFLLRVRVGFFRRPPKKFGSYRWSAFFCLGSEETKVKQICGPKFKPSSVCVWVVGEKGHIILGSCPRAVTMERKYLVERGILIGDGSIWEEENLAFLRQIMDGSD